MWEMAEAQRNSLIAVAGKPVTSDQHAESAVDRSCGRVSPVTTGPSRNTVLVPWIWRTRMSSSDGFHPDLRTTGTEHTVASSRT